MQRTHVRIRRYKYKIAILLNNNYVTYVNVYNDNVYDVRRHVIVNRPHGKYWQVELNDLVYL